MRYVALDGKQASVLGFGCGSVMGRVGRAQSLRAMNAAWDAGVTLFDTARSYGYGEAEGLLGEFLQGKRERAVVVTKFGILPSRPSAIKRWAKPLVRAGLGLLPQARGLVRRSIAGAMSAGHFDVATLRSSLETSLRELRMDYVDALLMHEAPASVMAQDDLMAELEKVVAEGKARRAGIAARGKDVAMVALTGPKVLSVLQYPAMGISDWPAAIGEERFRVANHPMGGPVVARRVASLLAEMAGNPQVNESLRAKLQQKPMQLVAEYWFTRAMLTSRPDVIVTSMLKAEHLEADVAAMENDDFSPQDVAEIGRWITGERLLD